MNAAEITALCTGVPAIIGAVTALVIALRSRVTANTAQKTLIAHMTRPGQHQRPKP